MDAKRSIDWSEWPCGVWLLVRRATSSGESVCSYMERIASGHKGAVARQLGVIDKSTARLPQQSGPCVWREFCITWNSRNRLFPRLGLHLTFALLVASIEARSVLHVVLTHEASHLLRHREESMIVTEAVSGVTDARIAEWERVACGASADDHGGPFRMCSIRDLKLRALSAPSCRPVPAPARFSILSAVWQLNLPRS